MIIQGQSKWDKFILCKYRFAWSRIKTNSQITRFPYNDPFWPVSCRGISPVVKKRGILMIWPYTAYDSRDSSRWIFEWYLTFRIIPRYNLKCWSSIIILRHLIFNDTHKIQIGFWNSFSLFRWESFAALRGFTKRKFFRKRLKKLKRLILNHYSAGPETKPRNCIFLRNFPKFRPDVTFSTSYMSEMNKNWA